MKPDAHEILIKPLLTEKSTLLREGQNKISFAVRPAANKLEIRRAVEEALKVRVSKVSVVRMTGKRKRSGRYTGKRPDWKKAVVTLREGEKTDMFEQA